MPTVDDEAWRRKRIAFLEELLEDDLPDEQRAAIDNELSELRAATTRGWRRWLWPVRLPHQR
jgi:hypothetical protein